MNRKGLRPIDGVSTHTNTRSSICKKRPMLTAALTALAIGAVWAAPAVAVERWKITGLSVKPDPTHVNEFNQLSYMDHDKLTVKCSYEMIEGGLQDEVVTLIISDNGVVKQSNGVTEWQGDTKAVSYNISGLNLHHIKCMVVVSLNNGKKISSDEKTVIVNVMAGKPAASKWPTAPIIVTPKQNQKVSGGNIKVKPYNPWLSHCADGGIISLDWQYLDKSTSTWKPINKLSALWKCVPEGSIKDISGMNPGSYKVRAMETNTKYKFTSDWSDWVTFEIVGVK